MEKHALKVDEQNDKQRIDVYISQTFPSVPSRTYVKHLIDNGLVTVNGKIIKAHYKVSLGDEIEISIEEKETIEDVEPENIPLEIYYEDEHFLVINKPVGMLVHPTTGCKTGTLVNAVNDIQEQIPKRLNITKKWA